ncbi:flagellar FlbD family protein [Rosenbergiella australiborealis]|uniref:Flagellar FlbD family protein n=1 Tax=Rosenbergiella australiborealis TaxID=1544696 RepID=A0ABS5T2Y3_9GAMM|nr:flagellar FlbD family protein [Rosenbergiella australiborealis]
MIRLTTLRGDKLLVASSQIMTVESHGSKSIIKLGDKHEKIFVKENVTEIIKLIDSETVDKKQ